MLKGNKLLLALLLPVFVLAFCFAAFALDENDFIIVNGEHLTPEEWASKQQVDMSVANPDYVTPEQAMFVNNPATPVDEQDEALRFNPRQSVGVDKNAPLVNLLFESFESNVMPPTGWTTVENNDSTWHIYNYNPYDGLYYANCNYDASYTGTQNEWFISPVVDLTTSGGPWTLEFAWLMSYYWGVSPYDNYDLEVWISTDGGANFSTMLWTEGTAVFTNWVWYVEQIDLSAYSTESNVKFGFRYSGYDGAQGSFDYISVNDAAPPVGRCCYGNPLAPSCADETQAACEARPDDLSWDAGLNCSANPCPVSGVGDNCLNPILVTLSGSDYADYGNYTCGRGNDYDDVTCMGYYDGGEDIMYEVTASVDVYVNITVNPNGTTYAGFALGTECPPVNCLMNKANSSASTPFGGDIVLPAGTYYLMVDTWPAPDCLPDFDLIITDLGTPPTPPANDDCANATPITLPTQVSGTTIASTIDCPGLLDWNAVWYIFDLTSTGNCSNVTVDYSPTLQAIYTVGVIFMDDCACDDYILYTTIEWVSSRPIIKWNQMPDGTYYFPAYVTLDAGDAPMDFVFDIYAVDCPPAPANDNCANAQALTGPWPGSEFVTGSTIGSTLDCPGLLDWNAVWYVFDVPSDWPYGYTVKVEWCGTYPDLVTVGVVLMDDCACDDYILHTATDWTSCGDGNPTSLWNCMPAGTYYYPAFTGPGTYGGAEQDFQITFTLDTCGTPTPGDNCADPYDVVVTPAPYPPGFTFVDHNYTCGRGNAESATCLGSYDGGEDIFYALIITEPICLDITLDPLGTTYTGIALGAACPPPGSSTSSCLAYATGSSSLPKGFKYTFMTPGVYFLMIDTWPSPNCIPAFDLYIEECPPPQPGDNCMDPLKVNLPADCPFITTDSTCGRSDDYRNTCMSSYDGGEDILYEVNIDEAGYYEFMMDPMGTTWTGMGLGADCPPPGTTYTDCIAEVSDYSSNPHGFVVFLTPDTYYLMIDTYPSPYCIPMFGLTITCLEPPLLIWDKTMIEFCNAVTGGTGSDILTLTNDGDVDLTYGIFVQYGIPPTKGIADANISTAEMYNAGTTDDLMFTIANNSTGAEWIDSFTMTFPTGVTVNSADFLDCASGDMIPTILGQTVSWVCDDPPMGCMYSYDVEDFYMNLTFDGGLSGPLVIDWTISGDDYGSPPHDITGFLVLPENDPYTQWLSVSPASGTIAGKGSQPITVSYDATLIDPGLYFASLVINHDGGMSPITIPVTLSVGDDHDPIAVIVIDRSGSMALTDAFDVTRIDRAKALAHVDADQLLGGGSSVAVMSFNGSDGIQLLQDFTTVVQDVHDAIDAVVNPRHDTPLAAAMCQAHCLLYEQGCGDDAIYTYTDGEENMSLLYDMCHMCDRCYFFHETGWNYDCIPGTGNCTDWQECLADVFSDNAVTIVNYFGSPINPFTKSGTTPEDLYFLKYTAEASGGEFNYYADAAFVPGDANGDAMINVSDAVYIINYVFVAGPAPQPLESADGNCDGDVNVSDAVFLINHVFTGGPGPDNCE
jgi:hypothetical protein